MSNTESEIGREINKGEGDDSPPTPNPQPPTPDQLSPGAHSRRDFLRRAGTQAVKDAVEIGSKVVPGGALVRQFVESADARTQDDDDDDDPLAIPTKTAPTVLLKNPLNWFAAWREGRKNRDE